MALELVREKTIDQNPLAIRGLTVSYAEKPAVFSVDVSFQAGQMTAIVGPNGAGKSTLLKAALGILRPLSGQVTAFGAPLDRMRARIAYVPQRASVDWDFPARVIDVVMMGLYRDLGLLGRIRPQQRVFLARALAQGADLYLLDEPFAGVDAATERAIIGVLKGLRDAGKTVVAVHHDLTTVPAYFDRAFLLNISAIAEGPVAEVMTEANLRAAYGGRLGPARQAV
jgi:manganese/zinc/iron transport system ATP- binding protein